MRYPILTANLLSGLVPGFIAPVSWPVVVVLMEGHWPDWDVYPSAALSISAFGFIGGAAGCLLVRVPALVILRRLDIHGTWAPAAVGALACFAVYLWIGPDVGQMSIPQSWPVAAFLSIMGAICGALAGYLARRSSKVGMDASY
jgi:hypothetical protein